MQKQSDADVITSCATDTVKKDIIKRLKRVEGQVRGIQRMIEDGKECEDILMQVKAARSALQSASKMVLKRYITRCHSNVLGPDAEARELDKVISVLTQYLEG